MKNSIYTPIVKKAAQAYFREDDAPLGWINNTQHRAFIDAVHRTYSAIGCERERGFIESVYKDPSPDFAGVVASQAHAHSVKVKHAWDIIRRFVEDSADAVKL